MVMRAKKPLTAAEMFWNLVAARYERYQISHVIMLVIIALYSVAGALSFCALERDNEERALRERIALREATRARARSQLYAYVESLLDRRDAHLDANARNASVAAHLDIYDAEMAVVFATYDRRFGDRPRWRELWTGLYYSGTLYTTIGYGDVTARTLGGRLLTIVYALVGIPLTVTVLNVWGGGLYTVLQSMYKRYAVRSAKYLRARAIRSRKAPPTAQYNEVTKSYYQWLLQFPLITSEGASTTTLTATNMLESPKVPLKLAFLVIIGWVLLCSGIFMYQQSWDFLTALYFTSVSLTTVGLGDVTIEHKVAVLNFLLILVGLAVVSMSISIIQVHVEAVFSRIIRLIESDFKKKIVAERRKVSMGTSSVSLDRKPSTTVLSISVTTKQPHTAANTLSPPSSPSPVVSPIEDVDAVDNYTTSLSGVDRFLVKLMSAHQKRLINERFIERARLRSRAIQTDERKISAHSQTERYGDAGAAAVLSQYVDAPADASTSSSEEDEDADGVPSSAQALAARAQRRRASLTRKPHHKRGLSRKKLYIYNTGD